MSVVLWTFLSHWRRAPLQLALMVVGLALATALWSGVQAINSEARHSYARAVSKVDLQATEILTSPSGAIPLKRYAALRRAGWQLSPVLEGRWPVNGQTVTLVGIDMLSYPGTERLFAATSEAQPRAESERQSNPLDTLTAPGAIFGHPDSLMQLGDIQPRKVAVNSLPKGVVFADISLASQLLGRPDQLSRLIVLPSQPIGIKSLATLAPDLTLQTQAGGASADPGELTDSFHLNLTAFGLLSFAVGLFIVQGMVSLSIEHRRGTIRTLRSLGVSLRMLVCALLIELLALAFVAGLLGLVLGYLLAGALMPDVRATLEGLYGAEVAGSLSLRPNWIISGLGMALGGVMLASVQAFITLRNIASHQGQAAQSRGRMRSGAQWAAVLAGLGLMLGGVAVMYLMPGLFAGFVFLGGLMLGGALLLPVALILIIRLALKLSRRPLLRWLLADTDLQVPGLSLALMALMLAIATNIGVGTMVSSFRLTFISWIDQRLSAELYVRTQSQEQAESVIAWAQNKSLRSLPQYYAETPRAGDTLRIYGVVDDPDYRRNWPLIAAQDSSWDKLHVDGYVFVNEQLSNRESLNIGDVIALTTDWSAQIAGIYSDYGNPHGQAITAVPQLKAHMPQVTLRQVGLTGVPTERLDDLSQALVQDLQLPFDAVAPQSRIRDASVAIFERTFLVTGALNLLTLGVAGFAMLTSFLSQWSQRLPHLAPIWAMGVTRAQLATLELLRSLALAAITFVCALPLGLALAWSLLQIINVEAFGWRLPVHVFPMDWLKLAILTGFTAGLAALMPAIRLIRIAPAALLGVFADER